MYIQLLAMMWASGLDGMKLDDEVIAWALRVTPDEWQAAFRRFQAEGDEVFIAEDGWLFSARLRAERAKQQDFRKARQAAGRKGGKAKRKQKEAPLDFATSKTEAKGSSPVSRR